MLTIKQRHKIRDSLNKKVGPIEIILIPNRIQTRCIRSAKSDEAKSRLVFLALETTLEDMRRIYIPFYNFRKEDKKYGYPVKHPVKKDWFSKIKFW